MTSPLTNDPFKTAQDAMEQTTTAFPKDKNKDITLEEVPDDDGVDQYTLDDDMDVDQPAPDDDADVDQPAPDDSVDVAKETATKPKSKKKQKKLRPDKPQMVTFDEDVFGERVEYLEDSQAQLPSQTTEKTLNPIAEALNMELREDERTRNWAYTLSRGHSKNTLNGALSKCFNKGDWRQSVPSESGSLSGGIPKINSVSNVNLYGKEAILRLMSHLGGATNYQIPLWHTGIWVNIDPVTDSDMLALFRELNEDKIQLGRYTNGAIFSNTSAFTTKRVIDFIISKIGETTYRPDKNKPIELDKIISINDLPILILALCNSMYPKGFKHNRACVYNPKKCHHTYSGIVDFDKILWTNIAALTKPQIRLMSTACNGQVNKEIVDTWSNELSRPESRVVDLEAVSGAKIRFILKVPKYNEYVDSGYTWLNGISDSIGESIEIDDLVERNKYIDDNARATMLRQYGHYIKSVEFGDGNCINDNTDIEEVLSNLSSDSNIRTGLVKAITNFIDDTTISVVGIPTYECEECGGGQTDEGRGIYKHVLPLDMIELFFLILIDRVKRIKTTTI